MVDGRQGGSSCRFYRSGGEERRANGEQRTEPCVMGKGDGAADVKLWILCTGVGERRLWDDDKSKLVQKTRWNNIFKFSHSLIRPRLRLEMWAKIIVLKSASTKAVSQSVIRSDMYNLDNCFFITVGKPSGIIPIPMYAWCWYICVDSTTRRGKYGGGNMRITSRTKCCREGAYDEMLINNWVPISTGTYLSPLIDTRPLRPPTQPAAFVILFEI